MNIIIVFIKTNNISIVDAYDHPDWEDTFEAALEAYKNEPGEKVELANICWLMMLEEIPPDTYVHFWESERGSGFEDPEEAIIDLLQDEIIDWEEANEDELEKLLILFSKYYS